MNKSVLALSLALLSATGMNSAMASTGQINFEGRITSDTCPIEVVNPGDGSSSSVVRMGTVPAARFTAVGQEYVGKGFNLVIPDIPGCKGTDNEANVMFTGASDPSGDYYAINPGADVASGVAIAIRGSGNANVPPGTPTTDIPLAPSGNTVIPFHAFYRSIAMPVTAGVASADVNFTVTIK